MGIMADRPEQQLNIRWPAEPEPGEADARKGKGRQWLGIHFECCNVYVRIYRRADEREYVGSCPECRGRVRVRVGAGGLEGRIFRARPA